MVKAGRLAKWKGRDSTIFFVTRYVHLLQVVTNMMGYGLFLTLLEELIEKAWEVP